MTAGSAAEDAARAWRQRRRVRLPFWILASFAVQIVALSVVALLSYRGFEEGARVTERTTQSFESLRSLESVVSIMKDAETGQRGYLLTHDERYLQPYDKAVSEIEPALANLQHLLRANGAQVARLEHLQSLINEKMTELHKTIELERAGQDAAALALVHTNRGKGVMDSIRRIVGEIRNEEHATLTSSLGKRSQSIRSFMSLIVAGPLVILLFILGSAWTTFRDYRERETQSWVRAGHAFLSSRIHGEQRLDELGDKIVRFLAEYLDAQVGVIHAATPDGFARCGAYALSNDCDAPEAGGGLLEQAAKEDRILHVSDLPEDYLPVRSSLGSGKPRELLIVPATADGETSAVVELGFFRAIGTPELELLSRVREAVAVAFRSERYRARQAELLEETQRQAEQLQAQQEELRAANEELEGQSQKLSESQLTLESQQSELKAANAYLEEQTHTLESQKEALLATQRLLKDKASEIERASRYKSEFLANMSHELRTPLNSSLILAKILADNRDGNLHPEQIKYAESIYAAGNDLLHLINDILDLAKIEAGRVDLTIEPASVKALLEILRSRFEPLASQRGLELRIAMAEDCPPTVNTDAQRLQQILTNLLSNAVKFTEKGTIHLSVARNGSEHVAFTVEDTGIGIGAEQHETIFDAFRQADGTTNRKYGGTGLGLSICRELVALLDGAIHLESAEGRGSTFTVILPLRRAAIETNEATRVPQLELHPGIEPDTTPAAPFVEDDRDNITDPRRVLLIVEDDPIFAEILRDLGREHSFQCVIARDAAEGLRFAGEYHPVAVVLDIGLPDHSGLTVLELLKRDPSLRHVPIHVVSVHDYEKVARELGAVGYALKPVKREKLAEAFQLLEERLSREVKSVLVVEDDPVQRQAVAELLGTDRIEIVAVATAEEAIDQLHRMTFDCCVVDLMLPEVSGFELLERMSGDERCPFPPVIVYTARPLSLDEEQRLRRVSSSIIVKGVRSPERLLEEATLFLHQVEADLPSKQQRMLRAARDREAVFEGRHVLLVEDDVRNVFALTHALEPKGLTVSIARNGREALAKLQEDAEIDLVLMDVMMPEMDGLTATREIRKDDRWAALPIIAVTAKAMPDDRQACLEAGANEYIAKPIEVDKLLSLLRVWIPR